MKRKLLLLCVAFIASSFAYGQLNENFDGGTFPPTNWTQETGAGDWDQSNDIADNTSGSGYFARYDCYNIYGSTPAYLITPSLNVTSGDQTLEFWVNYYLVEGDYGNSAELYVDVSDDDGSTWTSGSTNYLIGQEGQGWFAVNIDLGDYEGQDFVGSIVKVRFSAVSDFGSYDIAVDDVNGPALFLPSCPAPSDQTETNITTTSADLGWTENGSATTWNIEWGPTGFTQGSGTLITGTTENPNPLSGLSPGTSYDWYVQSDCNGERDESLWTGPSTFNTACEAITTFPFNEGFNSGSTTQGCWTVLNENSDDITWDMDYTSNPYEGDEVAAIHTDFNGGDNDDYLISPQLTLTAGQRLKFWYRVQSSSEPNDFEVLLSTTGKDPADFTTTLVSNASYSNTTYMEMMVYLNAYSGNVYLAWHVAPGGLDGWRLYIDDVTVEDIPSCPPPSNQTETNITTTSADLGWIENGSATTWNIEWGPAGFTPGSGTMITGTTANPYSLSGLSSGTSYDWYVQSDCNGAREESTWVGPSTFTTNCDPFTATFSEDFDGVSTPDLPVCWSNIVNSTSSYATVETSTGSPHSSPNYVELYNSSDASATLILITPELSDLTSQSNQIRFWAKGSSGYQLIVGTMTDPTDDATFTSYSTIDLTDTYTEYTVLFDDSYTLSDEYIAFMHGLGGTYRTIYVDDFTYEPIPACPPPSYQTETNITASSADLGWTENGSATMWNIEYGPSGFTQGNGTVISGITSNPYSLSGLSEHTAYDWYVQADCDGARDQSDWVGPSTFVTACTSCCEHSVELVDSYEDGWNGGSLDVYVDGILVLDNITLASGGGPLTYQFDAMTGSDIDVYYTAGSYPTENEYTVYDGGGSVLGQSGQGGTTPTDLLNLEGFCPSCLPPTDQTVTNITTTSADLGWTANGSEPSWNIEWGPTGFTQGSGTLISNTTSNPYPLLGLTSGVTYDWYVQADCGNGSRDESAWTGPYTFFTVCGSTSIPYFEDFDNVTAPAFPPCMTVENTNGDDEMWETEESGLSAPNSAIIYYNSTEDMDDWFFTQELDLTGGVTYEVSFSYGASDSYPEDLEVDWGSSPSSTDMSGNPIYTANSFTGAWFEGFGSFTPPTSGTYYVGFHGFSPADQNYIVLDDIKVIEQVASATWNGSVNNDWDNNSNWTPSLPSTVTDVTIPTGLTNYPTLTSITFISSLTVESDATGDASILNDGLLVVLGNTTVQRYITGGEWHDLSAPTQGQTVNALYQPGGSPSVWLRKYNEPTNDRTYMTNLSDPLDPGAGFEVWVEAGSRYDITVDFTGDLQRLSDVTLTTNSNPVALSYSGPEPFGYNLIGNPYASPIDLDEGNWNITDVSPSFWVWNGTTYLAWNTLTGSGTLTNGIIPMGQGFFIQATSASASITIPRDARVHSSTGFYKNNDIANEGGPPQLFLKAMQGNLWDKMNISFKKETKIGFDDFDTRKLFAYSGNAPQIYSDQSGERLTINSLPYELLNEEFAVKVGFKAGSDGEQKLEADFTDFPDTEVLLEDSKTGNIQSLIDKPVYNFKANVDDDPDRFILHFNPIPTGIEDPVNENLISVYAFNKNICIKSKGAAAKEDKDVWLYDMLGRTIIHTNVAASTFTTIPVNHLSGNVIVKIISESGVKTNKLFIQ